MRDFNSHNVTLPAGQYVISDPCYVLSEDDYDAFIGQFCSDLRPNRITLRGHDMACYNTAHGDGCYSDNYGGSYPVDAGCIAAIPVALVDPAKMDENALMVDPSAVTFDFAIGCNYDKSYGTINYGGISITTDPAFCDHCGDEYDAFDESRHVEGECT